ncbi:MAG: LptE family protein [Phycisphaerales bacterium JB059]
MIVGARSLRCWLALALALIGAGCASNPSEGYAFGWTHSEDVRTIAVPMFDNRTYATDVEFALTEAIIAEIQRSTPWVVVGEERADTTLSGVLTQESATTLSTTPGTGLVQENALTLTVDFDWRDNRTGETLVARDRFSAVGTYAPAQGTGERREIGQRQAIRELARDIVAELRADW